jgi:cobalamin biosynthesis protein CbiG
MTLFCLSTTAATAYVAELKKPGVAAQFAAHELPADFAQHLADDLAAIAAARDEQETNREGGVASTATVGQLIAAGMKEVNYLDAIVNNKYTRAPEKLRAWQSASHIERPAQREKKPNPPAPAKP